MGIKISPRAHLRKARRNGDFARSYLDLADEFPDWVSTIAFYSALHFVDAYLAKEYGLHYQNHEERNIAVSNIHPLSQEISLEYLRLYELGLNSRYGSIEDNPEPGEARDAVNRELARIEEWVLSHLRSSVDES